MAFLPRKAFSSSEISVRLLSNYLVQLAATVGWDDVFDVATGVASMLVISAAFDRPILLITFCFHFVFGIRD